MSSDDLGHERVAQPAPPASLRPPIVVRWRQSLGSQRIVGFVAHGAYVAVQGGSSLGVCRLEDGELLWQTQAAPSPDDAYLVPTGEALLVVTPGSTTSEVEARDWASGRIIWTTAVPGLAVPQACSAFGSVVALIVDTPTVSLLHEVDLDGGALVGSHEVPTSCTMVLARSDDLLLGSRDFIGEGRGLYRVVRPDMRVERLLVNDIWSIRRGGGADVVSAGDYKSEDRFILGVDETSGEIRWRQPADVQLLAVDERQVASLMAAEGGEQRVALRDLRTGEAIWTSAPVGFLTAGGLALAADVVVVVDVLCLWFFDRGNGDLLEMIDLDEMTKVQAEVTSEGILTLLDDQIACLTRP